MRPLATCANGKRRQCGYTLIELLVVMAIISVLAGLSVGAVMMFITVQHEKTTKTQMKEINGGLNKQWNAVVQLALQESMDQQDSQGIISTMAGGDEKRRRVLYVKFRLKQEFPTSFAEALNPYPLKPKAGYVAYLQNYNITPATVSATPAAHESSACLYMALKQSSSFNADQLGVAVREFDAPNGKIKGFTDSWTNPLVFSRWPTGDNTLPQSLDQNPPVKNTKVRDLQDPDGTLLNATWWASTNRTTFEQYGHSLRDPNNPNQSHAYYLIPVIVSAGRDGKLGLIDQTSLARDLATNAWADNIYSYNLDRE